MSLSASPRCVGTWMGCSGQASFIRVCGHIGVANSKALELAGIGREKTV